MRFRKKRSKSKIVFQIPDPAVMTRRRSDFGQTGLRVIGLLAILAIATVWRPSRGESAALKKITLMTEWLPQAQFGGFYAAKEKGLYEKYGLDVTVLHGGPSRSPYDFLEKGEADVAMLWLASGIEKRAKGIRLIHIAQIVQKSALMLIAKKSSGIETPGDMEGKKIGLWDSIYQIQPKAFFKKSGIRVVIVPQSYSVNLFLRDGVDAASAMWFNEYHTILDAGYDPDELTTFFFSDYGLNFPEDGLYATEAKFSEDPARYEAFVKASMEGWRYAFEHEEEILGMVLQYMKEAHVPANYAHQRWMLERMKDLILPQDRTRPMGALAAEDYENTARVLKESGLIDGVPLLAEFHKGGEGTHAE